MLIGVPREVKTHEYRVGLIPGNVRELVHNGHKVLVETVAGAAIGFDDAAYAAAGATILGDGRVGLVFPWGLAVVADHLGLVVTQRAAVSAAAGRCGPARSS